MAKKKYTARDLYLDIQLAWIKEARKDATHYFYQFTTGSVYLGNGFYFYKIPVEACIIDKFNLDSMFPGTHEVSYSSVLAGCEYMPADDTGMRKQHFGHNLIILKNDLGVETAINKKFVSVFKGMIDYNTGKKGTDPVVLTVFDGTHNSTEVLGLVLPVNLGKCA